MMPSFKTQPFGNGLAFNVGRGGPYFYAVQLQVRKPFVNDGFATPGNDAPAPPSFCRASSLWKHFY